MDLRSLMPAIREVARQVVRRQSPEGEAEFDQSWSMMEKTLARWAKKPPEKWTSKELDRSSFSADKVFP